MTTAAQPPSPLDMPIAVTFFANKGAGDKREEAYTMRSLAARIRVVTALQKERLPWLKLGRFGNLRTEKDSLRHDANVLAVTGVEADYDGGQVTVEAACEVLEKQGIAALVYTSPSHTEDAHRWRVLCPFSAEMAPERRQAMLGRLNGLMGGIFSGESWTLSQGYYFGSVNHNPSHRVELVDGTTIDLHDDLDEIWQGKPATGSKPTGKPGKFSSGPVDEAELLRQMVSGESYHYAKVRLLGLWARRGVPFMEARERLVAAMEGVFPPDRDARWRTRFDDIDRCLEDIYGRQAKADDIQDSVQPQGTSDPEPPPHPGDGRHAGSSRHRGDGAIAWQEPVDFLVEVSDAAPVLCAEHLPDALWGFVTDTATRMGVDPSCLALAALVACAAVVTDDWCIQPKRHDPTWTENPRLWGAIVGDPSVLKTPVIAACTKPVDRLEAEARKRHANQMRTFKEQLKAFKADTSGATPEPRMPILDRYMAEGSTVEALSEILRDDDDARQCAPASKILCRHDEMSEFFGNLDRYRSGGKGGGDRGAYLRLYNGGRYTIDRIGRGSFAVPNWSACFLGGIQPGPIQKIARETSEDGLLQRILYNVPGPQSVGEDQAPDAGALQRYNALFPVLTNLRPPSNLGMGDPLPVVLHAEAHQHRELVEAHARALAAMPDVSGRLKAAFGKWPGLFARIALTFHVIELADARARNETGPYMQVLQPETAARAADYMLDIVLPHLLRADAVMFSTAQTGHARWVAGYILAHGMGRVSSREVTRAYGTLRAPEAKLELMAVMESLVTIGWLEPEVPTNPVKPVTTWVVNPAVHVRFAEAATREREARDRAREQVAADIDRLRERRTTGRKAA